MKPEPSEVVGHHARRELSWVGSQQWSETLAQGAVGETVGQMDKHQEGLQQSHDAGLTESKRGRTLTVDVDRSDDSIETIGAHVTVVGEGLDVQQTSVGVEADFRESGEVVKPLADREVVCVVDRRLGPESSTELVVLFDEGVLVLKVQGRGHVVTDDPSPEETRCPTRDLSLEDELNVLRPSQVDVLSDDLFEEGGVSLD